MDNYKNICDELKSIYQLNDYMFQQYVQDNVRGLQDMCGEAADAIEELKELVDFITVERDKECDLRHRTADSMQVKIEELQIEKEHLKAQLDAYHKFDGFLMMHGCFEK